MSFTSLTDRSDVAPEGDASGLIPEDAATEIIKEATESSAVMRVARRLPDMSRRQRRLPVLDALPTAYFVNAGQNQSDTRHKRTTKMEWDDVFINAEEIAVIAPIPENVLDDAAFDIWGETRPAIAEAIGMAFDRAILYAEGKPNVWPDGLVDQIIAAGHLVDSEGTGDVYDHLLGEEGLVALVEEDGYMVDGYLSKLNMRGRLRGLRDGAEGKPIFERLPQGPAMYALDGETLLFPRNGSFVAGDPVDLIGGDWTRLVYSIRQDISWKVLDQAVITDPTDNNAIVMNLAQQDMVALRVTFRAGWALPQPASRLHDGTGFPFAAYGAVES